MRTNPDDIILGETIDKGYGLISYGLTKRELFAVLSLQALGPQFPKSSAEAMAQLAVEQADALIKELNEV